MAYGRRRPPCGMIFHSDRGNQYCSREFREALKAYGMIQSQSRKGNCWSGSPMESFFQKLKAGLMYREEFETKEEAKNKIFEWIEVFNPAETSFHIRVQNTG